MNAHGTTTTQTQTTTISATHSKTLIAASMAAFLGVFMIWGVGFSHIAAAHNAAHDVRHSNGFPCH
jgi:cobalt transporter subunit CbtB